MLASAASPTPQPSFSSIRTLRFSSIRTPRSSFDGGGATTCGPSRRTSLAARLGDHDRVPEGHRERPRQSGPGDPEHGGGVDAADGVSLGGGGRSGPYLRPSRGYLRPSRGIERTLLNRVEPVGTPSASGSLHGLDGRRVGRPIPSSCPGTGRSEPRRSRDGQEEAPSASASASGDSTAAGS